MFDADAFMNSTIDQSNSTKVKPAPVGEYFAEIKDVKPSSGTISKGENAGKPWARLSVVCEVSDPSGALEAEIGSPTKRVTASIMLDLNDAGNGLDMREGKNVRLGRLREAANLNRPGEPFAPPMLIGRTVKVKVGHRTDDTDPETVYDEITGFAPLS